MRGGPTLSMDHNAWVLGGYIRFSPLLNKQVCCVPFARLLESVLLTLSRLTLSPEEDIRAQLHGTLLSKTQMA
ncbi:hypothetical protein ACRRTK_002289 [Alexandromys fortis]